MTSAPPPGRPRASTAARRYPALAYLAGAVALALLLPSGLTLPNDGPSTLAEYAPVPGQGQGVAPVAAFGETSSGGVGAGAGRPGAAPTTTAAEAPGGAPGRIVRKPGAKRCVGNPPRQTEDPLSPPCVAFFEGDNGGATWKGVTREEVRVVAKFANFNQRTDPNYGRSIDCSEAPRDGEPIADSMCKAYQRYFNDRYQTYGRDVKIFSSHEVPVSELIRRHDPFAGADISLQGNYPNDQRVGIGFSGGTRANVARYAPYGFTFRPDNEYRMELLAGYLCNRLAGRPARHAGDPALHTRQRKFGILFWNTSPTSADRLTLKARVRERCSEVIEHETDDFTTATGLARLRSEGVTSVIVMVGNTGHVTATNNATSLGWFPEWIIAAPALLYFYDTNFFGRQANQAQWANAFGVTIDVRRDAFVDQPWFRAYREGCPECRTPNASDQGVVQIASMYETLSMLFYGVQAGGPRLTPHSVDKGLKSIPPQGSDDPFKPAAYFTSEVGGYLKDAMEIWWDPSGQAPDANASGCYRLVRDGRRSRPDEWPAGDAGIKSGGRCQGETFS